MVGLPNLTETIFEALTFTQVFIEFQHLGAHFTFVAAFYPLV